MKIRAFILTAVIALVTGCNTRPLAASGAIGLNPAKSFSDYRLELNMAAWKREGMGRLSPETLKANAIALYKYLIGRDPRPDERLSVVSPWTEKEYPGEIPDPKIFKVCIGYDNGLNSGGIIFGFDRYSGELVSMKFLRGE